MIIVWNPAQVSFNGTLSAPMSYSGVTHASGCASGDISFKGSTPIEVPLTNTNSVDIDIKLGPREFTWIVIGEVGKLSL